LQSWRRCRQADPNAQPPGRRRRYFKVIWKSSAPKVQDGKLYLSDGKGNLPVVIPWAWGTPVQVEIGWDGKQYELRACYDLSQDEPVAGSIIAEPVVFGSIATALDRPICAESIWDSLMSRQSGAWHSPSGCSTNRISDAAQEVGAILQPEKESFAFRRRRMSS
jgi:hypothetical protein